MNIPVIRRFPLFLAFLVLTSVPFTAANSGEGSLGPKNGSTKKHRKSTELYVGANATENGWFSYAGASWAPFGAIDVQGIRVKLLSGYGEYSYVGTATSSNASRQTTKFSGTTALSELMLGYFFTLDPVYLKLYVGAAWQEHLITPFDPLNRVIGSKIGGKGQAELWINIGEAGWLSSNASYASTFDSYNVSARLGYDITPSLSIGPEIGALGNSKYDAAKAGAFMRLHGAYGELTLSGGVSGDYEEPTAAYGAVSYSMKY